MKLKLNAYPMIPDVEEKIAEIIKRAVDNKARLIEIAYGPASESYKRRILRFLGKKEVRKLYSRLEKTDSGWRRVYLYFRW
jgi:hypothetical protein